MDQVSQATRTAEAKIRAAFASLPQTQLRAALIGNGIGQSRTPWMHKAEGARLRLDYAYSLIDFDRLGLPDSALVRVLELAGEQGFAGLNVTHPFKQRIIHHLDALSDEAAAIGAVNTVVFARGRSIGHNTDCWGFAESFRSEMANTDLRHVLLLGAGGAGKAVSRALRDLGAERISIVDLERERAVALAASLNGEVAASAAADGRVVEDTARIATGLVNTTPVGMAKYPGTPIRSEALRPDLWVADVVYFPAETELLRAARVAGCRVMSGKGMAVFQAVRAFELITGRKPDSMAMFRHFDATLQSTLD